MNGTDRLYNAWHSAMANSHRRLVAIAADLDTETCSSPSYAKDWSIAQVLSHLGSGTEIYTLVLRAGATGTKPPERDEYPAIWARWDAKAPRDQVQDSLRASENFLEELDALDGETKQRWAAPLFGGEQDLTGLLKLRLSEHAVHTWDVASALDRDATVADDAVELLLDRLPQLAARTGKAPANPLRVEIETQSPNRRFLLVAEEGAVRLEPDAAGATARLELPAEALLRLVYGRLDAGHTPKVAASGVDLEQLRSVFPGY